MLEALKDSTKEDPTDKLRLLLCYFLSNPEKDIPDLPELERALKETGVDLKPLEFVKKLREFTRMSNLGAAPVQASGIIPGGELFRGFSSITNRVSLSQSFYLENADEKL